MRDNAAAVLRSKSQYDTKAQKGTEAVKASTRLFELKYHKAAFEVVVSHTPPHTMI